MVIWLARHPAPEKSWRWVPVECGDMTNFFDEMSGAYLSSILHRRWLFNGLA
jgi:hypothetical protein